MNSEFGNFFAHAAFIIAGIIAVGFTLLFLSDIKWHWVRKRTKYTSLRELVLLNQLKFILVSSAIISVFLFGTIAIYAAVTL
jgi:hypothetical protein